VIQWNPSTKATLGAKTKWPFERGGLNRGVNLVRKMATEADSTGLDRGVTFLEGGLCRGVPLYWNGLQISMLILIIFCQFNEQPSLFM